MYDLISFLKFDFMLFYLHKFVILVFYAVKFHHRWMMVFLMVFSSQISLCVVLFITAPYRVYCFVREQTKQEETPQFRELALLPRKSPNDDFDTAISVNLHGLHKA